MELEDLGYNKKLEKFRIDNKLMDFEVGRIVSEHKERYIVKTQEGEWEAQITGNLRFTSTNREDYPAVGDWVALIKYDSGLSIIHKVLPRFSIISREHIDQSGEKQIIATNIDYAFLVQAVDRDFNINRLERYLTICYSSNVTPIIVLTKIDLVNGKKISEIVDNLKSRVKNVPIITVSNKSQEGYNHIKTIIEKGKTYCMLGSSGVGKSTLLNNLSGKNIMRTDTISQDTHKGRHITSHRQLVILRNGGILIDNPGMREVGIADSTAGLDVTFETINRLSQNCKFNNCTHTNEIGCAVLDALMKGELDKASYHNYLKMERENAHFQSTIAEKRKRDKDFGKSLKNYKKDKNKKRH